MALFLAGLAAGTVLAAVAVAWAFRSRRRRLGRLFAFGTHEINSPITAVNMMILNFRSGAFGPLDEGQREWMELLREQIGRLNGLMGELRDLIHLELDSDLYMPLADLEVKSVVEAALLSIRSGAAHAKVEIQSSVDDNLPKVLADEDRLPRTLTSLLFHARKFRVSGPIVVGASVAAPGGPVLLRVEYTGPKISAEAAARTLGLFYPARGRRDHLLSATGLGLGLLRTVTRRQGGDLGFSVDADGRSALVLTLPSVR